jgi:hypothetical protein
MAVHDLIGLAGGISGAVKHHLLTVSDLSLGLSKTVLKPLPYCGNAIGSLSLGCVK